MGKGLSDKDIKKMKVTLKDINEFIDKIEKMGGEVPPALKKSLKQLETAINTGKDIAKAADQASKNLKKYQKDLMNACKTVSKDQRMACEAGVSRQYMAQGVKWTLDPNQKEGTIENFIKNTIKRYTPDAVCKHWDYCAKAAK